MRVREGVGDRQGHDVAVLDVGKILRSCICCIGGKLFQGVVLGTFVPDKGEQVTLTLGPGLIVDPTLVETEGRDSSPYTEVSIRAQGIVGPCHGQGTNKERR